jgi:AraC-like DNA-binding protein
MIELLRAACLHSFPEVARSVGLQPERLLAEAGIDRRALDDPEIRIPVQAFRGLLEAAAQQSGVEAFGLRLAETRHLSVLGPIGLLMREEPTVRQAILTISKYLAVHNEALAFYMDEVDGQAVARFETSFSQPGAVRQGIELTVGVLFRVLQPMIGRQWQPIVCFVHEAPVRRDMHHRLFGPRVDFLCNFNGIIFSTQELDRPVPNADPAFAEHARRYLDSLMGQRAPTWQAKVRELVRLQLTTGRCTADRLARQMGCDRRTLYRRLAQENVTFDGILNSVRANLAVNVLEIRNSNMASAADLLGFSSTSAFSRWFLAEFGKRPSDWRKDSAARIGL